MFWSKELTRDSRRSVTSNAEMNSDATNMSKKMAVKILTQLLKVAPERRSLENDRGPAFVKRAIETSATTDFGTPWRSTAMDAIMDVMMAASDPMAALMSAPVRVIACANLPPSITRRHDMSSRSWNQSQDKNVTAPDKMMNHSHQLIFFGGS